MNLWKRIKMRIYVFFRVQLPLFIDERSLFTKILLAIGTYLLIYLFLFGLFFGGAMLVSSIQFDLELSHSTEQIARIEIIHVGDDGDSDDREFRNITVCAVLEEAQWKTFLAELHEVTCRGTAYEAKSHIFGATVRITYQDGTFDLLSSSGFFFSSDVKSPYRARTLDSDELLELLTAYGYYKPET